MDQGAKHRCDICGWKGWRQIWNLQCKTSWQIGKTTEKYPRYFIIFILITNIEQIFRTVETWFCHGHYSWLRLLWMNPLPTPVLQLQKCRLRRVSNQSIWDQQGLLQCSSQNLISMRDLRCTHALDPSLMAVPAWYGFWSKTMLLCGARCGQCILLYFVIPLDTIFEIEGGGLLLKFIFGFLFSCWLGQPVDFQDLSRIRSCSSNIAGAQIYTGSHHVAVAHLLVAYGFPRPPS